MKDAIICPRNTERFKILGWPALLLLELMSIMFCSTFRVVVKGFVEELFDRSSYTHNFFIVDDIVRNTRNTILKVVGSCLTTEPNTIGYGWAVVFSLAIKHDLIVLGPTVKPDPIAFGRKHKKDNASHGATMSSII